jgi:hypothetical protein
MMKVVRSLIGGISQFCGASRQRPEAENGAIVNWSRGKSLCHIFDSIVIIIDRSDGNDKGGEYLKNSLLLDRCFGGDIPLSGGRHNNIHHFFGATTRAPFLAC